MKSLKVTMLVSSLSLLLFAVPGSSGASSSPSVGNWSHAGFTQWHPQSRTHALGSTGTQCFFCKPDVSNDDDNDGVLNNYDQCPGTPHGVQVDAKGCPIDSDGDGVADHMDKCPGTPYKVKVDANGCPLDSDGDGVLNEYDQCPGTPPNVKVDVKGCPMDSDGDGVIDIEDACPDTPSGAEVTRKGCWVIKNLKFRFNKSEIDPESSGTLNVVRDILRKNPNMKVEIQGHTDSVGGDAFNQTLSEKRAKAAMMYLVNHGIEKSRLSSRGFGEGKPVTSNATKEGRAENRRAEVRH